jgi:hypothetical protein
MKRCLGRELKVGDVIRVWWRPGTDIIAALQPYQGPLAYLWQADGGARLATLVSLPSRKMTIEPGLLYDVLSENAGLG